MYDSFHNWVANSKYLIGYLTLKIYNNNNNSYALKRNGQTQQKV